MTKIAFVVADDKNLSYYEMMLRSLRKFHSEEELPVKLISGNELKLRLAKDPDFFYRATPTIAQELLKDYDVVIKLDADQIITGSLGELWDGVFDVAVVNNSNPREFKSYPYSFLNIHPYAYVNCGLVVMRSKEFVDFWYNFCFSTFWPSFQMREQDFYNILVHSNNYKIKRLDEGDSFYGLASKGYWPDIILKGEQLFLPKGIEWPDKDKLIKVLHWAGGNSPDKMNYKIRFKEEVVKRLDELTK